MRLVPGAIALLLLVASPAHAEGNYVFGGLGLNYGALDMQDQSEIRSHSKFSSQGYLAEGGIDLGKRSGFRFSGVVGKSTANNTFTSTTSLEQGSLTYYGVKAGAHYEKVAFGAGYRFNDAIIKSLSTGGNGYLESHYKGSTPFIYGGLDFDIDERFRTSIEGSYATGSLKAVSSSFTDIKINETSIGLRFFVLFN